MDKNNDILMDGIDERIEAFLRGEMTADEETAFRQEIKTNPELRDRAKAITSLIRSLQAKNTAKERAIIEENTERVAKFNIADKSRMRPILWLVCSVAAVIAVIFVFYPSMSSMSPSRDDRYALLDATVSPYYMEYDMSDISRGDVDSATIVHLYGLFTQIQENRNMSDIIKELEPIYNSLENDFTYNAYANDIAWNLALAYVKDDQIDKAIPILQKLKDDNPETPIYNKADKLIKKLQDL